MNKMTIEELAKKANERLKLDDNENDKFDQRCSDEISVRRIRDYTTKGILDKPLKEGRNAFYTEQHLEKLISIRQMQSEGFSDNILIKANTTSLLNYEDLDVEHKEEKDDAMDIINQIKNRDNMPMSTPMAYASSHLASRNITESMDSMQKKICSEPIIVPKNWEEYNLDDSGDIVLKIENNHKIKNIDKLINNFKIILKNKED
jgi:DNA-binding transcriptional MerR regulator